MELFALQYYLKNPCLNGTFIIQHSYYNVSIYLSVKLNKLLEMQYTCFSLLFKNPYLNGYINILKVSS